MKIFLAHAVLVSNGQLCPMPMPLCIFLIFGVSWFRALAPKKDERYKDVTIKIRLESAAEDFVMTEKKTKHIHIYKKLINKFFGALMGVEDNSDGTGGVVGSLTGFEEWKAVWRVRLSLSEARRPNAHLSE